MLSHIWLAPLLGLFVLLGLVQQPTLTDGQDPVVWSQIDGEGVVATLHSDGTMTASKLVVEEGLLVTSTTAPQGGTTGAPTPTLSTSYTGVDGATHTVTTPVPSTTNGGMATAMTTHRTLVALMKQAFPPAP